MAIYKDDAYPTKLQRIGVVPTAELRARIIHNQITLHELFVEGRRGDQPGARLARMRTRARYQIVMGFAEAIDQRHRSSDNAIAGSFDLRGYLWSPVGDSLYDLWLAIAQITRRMRPTVRADDLPEPYRSLEDDWRNRVIATASHQLVMEELAELQTPERKPRSRIEPMIWYHSGSEVWQASQSLIDQLPDLQPSRRNTNHRPKKPGKIDKRTWHGRPGGQGRRRAKQQGNPGASVGGVR